MQEEDSKKPISQEEIDKCVSILESLNEDTLQIFDIPKELRLSLIKAAEENIACAVDRFDQLRVLGVFFQFRAQT